MTNNHREPTSTAFQKIEKILDSMHKLQRIFQRGVFENILTPTLDDIYIVRFINRNEAVCCLIFVFLYILCPIGASKLRYVFTKTINSQRHIPSYFCKLRILRFSYCIRTDILILSPYLVTNPILCKIFQVSPLGVDP